MSMRPLALLALVAVLLWAALRLGSGPEAEGVRATLSAVGAIAGDDTAGYARAVAPRPFVFPADHGAHPEFRTEWWYFTGNLEGEAGRAFAFQLTFFRSALAPRVPERASGWSTNQLWMAHFALTDEAGRTHRAWERFARGAGGLAGASSDPVTVWVEDWSGRGPEGGGFFPLRLQAREGDWALDLTLDEGKPVVLQGEEGLSRKGSEPGNASYYFSFTRMPARGAVVVEGVRHPVSGRAWLDREWSTSALGSDHVGWDWFSLQLSDGRELMFFELRRADGLADPLNHGALVEPDGRSRTLGGAEVELEALGSWESPLDGVRYPSGWRLRIPGEGVDLRLVPLLPDQEVMLSFRYWEGAVRVEGMGVEGPVEGMGFVELTGYGER
jgi:predicted secreted hydrolase